MKILLYMEVFAYSLFLEFANNSTRRKSSYIYVIAYNVLMCMVTDRLIHEVDAVDHQLIHVVSHLHVYI